MNLSSNFFKHKLIYSWRNYYICYINLTFRFSFLQYLSFFQDFCVFPLMDRYIECNPKCWPCFSCSQKHIVFQIRTCVIVKPYSEVNWCGKWLYLSIIWFLNPIWYGGGRRVEFHNVNFFERKTHKLWQTKHMSKQSKSLQILMFLLYGGI